MSEHGKDADMRRASRIDHLRLFYWRLLGQVVPTYWGRLWFGVMSRWYFYEELVSGRMPVEPMPHEEGETR